MVLMVMMVVTVRGSCGRGHYTHNTCGVRRARVLGIIVVIVRHVQRTERLLVCGFRVLDETRLRLV